MLCCVARVLHDGKPIGLQVHHPHDLKAEAEHIVSEIISLLNRSCPPLVWIHQQPAEPCMYGCFALREQHAYPCCSEQCSAEEIAILFRQRRYTKLVEEELVMGRVLVAVSMPQRHIHDAWLSPAGQA